MPRVSVALATFNGVAYVDELLKSVLSQTTPVFEVVVSDDDSTDGTYEHVARLAKSDSRVLLLPKHGRLGYVDNFANAIQCCSGELIALCDQDDVWLPTKIESLLRSLGSADAVASNAFVTDSRLVPFETDLDRENHVSGDVFRFDILAHYNRLTGCTMMFRTTLRDRAIPFPDGIVHDWWLGLLAADGNGISYVPEPLVFYRQHDNNAVGLGLTTGASSLISERPSPDKRQIVADRYARRIDRTVSLLSRRNVLTDRSIDTLASILEYYLLFFRKTVSFRRGFLGIALLFQLPENRGIVRKTRIVLRSMIGRPRDALNHRDVIDRASALLKDIRE